MTLGDILSKHHLPRQAAQAYLSALEEDPTHEAALKGLDATLRSIESASQSVKSAEEAEQRKDDEAARQSYEAVLRQDVSNAGAVAALWALLKSDPKEAGRVFMGLDLLRQAENAYNDALAASPAPADEVWLALASIAARRAQADKGVALGAAYQSEKRFQEAAKAYDTALTADVSNQKAIDALAVLSAEQPDPFAVARALAGAGYYDAAGTEAERVLKEGEAQEIPADLKYLKRASPRWLVSVRSVIDSLMPLRDLALAFLYVFAALLVLARLTSIAVPWGWARTSARGRSFFWWAGLTLGAVASLLLTVLIASRSPWTPVALGAAVALVAIALIAAAMGTRLRLSVEVRKADGNVNQAATGQVIALLADLGGAPPSGLEVPRGSDVTTLSDTSMVGTPETKLIAALLRIWQFIFGTIPWRVRVDEESDDLHAVVITRNGRAVASAIVDRHQLDLRSRIVERASDSSAASNAEAADKGPSPDLHRFSAAVVLATLADRYEGFEGLFGVADWRSLGLHYVATTDYVGEANKAASERALAKACNYDTSNVPAAVALRHSQDRESVKENVLENYVAWLSRIWRSKLKPEHAYALRLRVLRTLVVTECNRRALDADKPDGTPIENHPYRADDDVYSAADRLIMDLDKVPELFKPTASAFAEEMHASAAAVYLSLGGMDADCLTAARGWLQEEYLFSPTGHYNYACLLARPHLPRESNAPAEWDVPSDEDSLTKAAKAAVLELKLASVDPECRAWMAEDPWLAQLRKTAEYKEAFPCKPRKDHLGLEPFVEYAEKLRAAGLHTAQDLANASPWRLARHLGVDDLVIRRLIRLAGLVASIDASKMIEKRLQVEVVAALLRQGIDSSERLLDERVARTPETLAEDIHNSMDAPCRGELTSRGILDWLNRQ